MFRLMMARYTMKFHGFRHADFIFKLLMFIDLNGKFHAEIAAFQAAFHYYFPGLRNTTCVQQASAFAVMPDT
ncbi:hypothetical protein Ctu_1p01090 (plasmid) [Cronobacter turicensis z3032]|uniref:Uncharacterized protein n=2 Tax=Cronobacter turicensis TaxID=413502 RepID=C9Y5K1_CROTZ|nr:hypothetical protein Ctu_1p01090 [Cronobacter turicensis z3032]